MREEKVPLADGWYNRLSGFPAAQPPPQIFYFLNRYLFLVVMILMYVFLTRETNEHGTYTFKGWYYSTLPRTMFLFFTFAAVVLTKLLIGKSTAKSSTNSLA